MGNNPCLASAAERSGVAGGGNPPAKSRRDRSSPSRGSKRQDNTGVQTTTERTNTLLQAVVETLTLPSLHAGARDNPEEAMQKRQEFKHRINKVVSAKYLLYLPEDYSPKSRRRWPLILFLHGAGERGTDLALVAEHGPPKLVEQRQEFPFIIVSPQCPEGETWSNEVLLGLLNAVTKKYRVDASRVYLTGISMGGYGTWSLGLLHPEKFAAIAPICGGGETIDVLLASRKKSKTLKTLAVWAFHGAQDPTVPLEESEHMVAALQKAGVKEVDLTVYPEAAHDSWTETYENPELYEWFLRHERKSAK